MEVDVPNPVKQDRETQGILVSIHPVVILSISEHYNRKCCPASQVCGALLGIQKSNRVEMINSFEFLLEPDGTVDEEFTELRLDQSKKMNENLEIVGWYSLGAEVNFFDYQINTQLEGTNKSLLLVKLQTDLLPTGTSGPGLVGSSSPDRLAAGLMLGTTDQGGSTISADMHHSNGDTGEHQQQQQQHGRQDDQFLPLVSVFEPSVMDLMDGGGASGSSVDNVGATESRGVVFRRVRYEFDNSIESEAISLKQVTPTSAVSDPRAQSEVVEQLTPQFGAVQMLRRRLQALLNYLQAVRSGVLPTNQAVLREVASLCHSVPFQDVQPGGGFGSALHAHGNDLCLTAGLAALAQSLQTLQQLLQRQGVLERSLRATAAQQQQPVVASGATFLPAMGVGLIPTPGLTGSSSDFIGALGVSASVGAAGGQVPGSASGQRRRNWL